MFEVDPDERLEFHESWRRIRTRSQARYICDSCDEPILAGDRFLEYDNLILCDECIRDNTRYA